MDEAMTASQMTDGQIENVCNKLRDALRKHRKEITSKSAQLALGVENLGMRLFAPFREQAEAFSDMVVRRVKVNRSRTPQQVISATGRTQSIEQEVVVGMPQGEGEEVEVWFFKLSRPVSDLGLEAELELHGLKPDPCAQSAVNEADPAFADSRPNGTHWKDAGGRWCYLAFYHWDAGERSVHISHRGKSDWGDRWWFGGVRK